MQELGLSQVVAGIEARLKAQDIQGAEALLWPALDQYPWLAALWFYAGNVHFLAGRNALSAECYRQAIRLEHNPNVFSNLGAVYRRMNDLERSRTALEQALHYDPDNSAVLANLGSLYVNEGNPYEGIPYLRRALQNGQETAASWNLGLLLLESGEFAEGFDRYRLGMGHERMVRNYGVSEDDAARLTRALKRTVQPKPDPKWLDPSDPREGRHLVVWGEQGLGDEILFATLLHDAAREFEQVYFDCHPRLEWLHRRVLPANVTCFPTRKSEVIQWNTYSHVWLDYKAGLADLGCLYRRSREAWREAWERAPSGAFYQVDPVERAQYRERLTALASGRPIVGLAVRGGVLQTARHYRTLPHEAVDELFARTDALFVSLDYENMLPLASRMQQRAPGRYVWFPAVLDAWDYQHQGALAAACDLVVTVCQSIAHLSAACNLPTRVLVPSRPAWRYGLEGEEWFAYPSPQVRLYRQQGDDWVPAIEKAIADIRGLRE